ncbi:MAG: penicillin amidase [Candidatus Melainabacteria bacterium GWF2_32_7]|nr:MAG: penicillin amidase [Candidatus Melainabacteria bacterium GWF2_32_7]
MNKWKKILIGGCAAFLVLIIAFSIISFFMLNKSLPEYNGEIRAEGLVNRVEILRDSFAIPFIKAGNDEDAAFALGFIHAQERLFQMDVARRAGEGRLSEVFGAKTIQIDQMFRTVGIYKNVKANYEKLNPLSKKILEAYSKGVNAFIKTFKGNYPVEFDLLGYDPYPWKPEHSLVIAKLMGWELNISWWSDITFTQLVQKFGAEKAKELLPDFPENSPTIIPSGLEGIASISSDFMKVDQQFRNFTGFVGTHIGSNNWIVNGKMSASGKPIIANDPHLAYTAPGRWYFAMIRSNDWNAEGFTIPGLPAIVIGKNKNISWALTNVMADDSDFYVEKIDSSGTNYFFNNSWRQLSIEKDTIHVKDTANVVYEIKRTHRGPIVTDIHPFKQMYPNTGINTAQLSMRWTGLEPSDEIFAAVSINKARNWDDFKNAVRYFTVPGQNFVYGDDKGNIGYICAARLPIRNSNSPTLINDGTTDANDWKGFVPYEEMPKLFNPPQNFIASANNKTLLNFKYHISNIWEPSSRIERITELLNSKPIHSKEDYKKYQLDFTSPYAKKLTRYITAAFDSVKVTEKNLKLTLELFHNWNYEMNPGSQVPTIYSRFFQYLIKNIFEDEMGVDLLKEYVFVANVPYRIIPKLLEKNSSSFFDDVRTPDIETGGDIIRKSLVDALTDLEKKYGTDIANWQWGEIHKVTFKHMFHDKSGLLDKIINIGPFNIGGDGTTIFNTEYSFPELFESSRDLTKPHRSEQYENILGPSMRYIFDFADPDHLEFILTTGESGHFMSDHYKDMSEMWLKGKYIKVPLREDEFRKVTTNVLKLIP